MPQNQHPREQLATIMQRIYQSGLTTLSGGNLSILDAQGHIWITPAGGDKGQLTAVDMVCVRADGTCEGQHRPSSELPFHRAIYRRRPDLRAIAHAHPSASVAFSLAHQVPDTRILAETSLVCGAVGYAPYALTGSQALGEVIAATFAQGHNSVILENHGLITAGETLLEAFRRLEALDFCARVLIRARMLIRARALLQAGAPAEIGTLDAACLHLAARPAPMLPEYAPEPANGRELALRQQLAAIVRRACARELMNSFMGVASVRLDADSFLITPAEQDRQALTAADMVLVRGGQREAGKWPDRSVRLHQAIYARHDNIGCVTTAQPVNVSTFAVTAQPFPTHTIPESYILLRQIPRVAFATFYDEPEAVASLISPQTPVLLGKNAGMLVTGKDLLQAFDRLEVAEFSARALVDTAVIGQLMPISDAAIQELRAAFPL